MSSNSQSSQKITPCLWFDRQAEEAAARYVALFASLPGPVWGDSRVGAIARYGEATSEVSGIAEGAVMTVEFRLAGQQFVGLNGGPEFSFTPAISFFVHCDSAEAAEHLWQGLSDGGQVLMPFDSYPFSEKFGWCNDRYGVSWQISLDDTGPAISPYFLFVGDQHGRAEEAIRFYSSLFDDSEALSLLQFGPAEAAASGETEGSLMHGRFRLAGQQFLAMDSGQAHDFTFTEAVSLTVDCQDQAEVDRLWAALTADGGEESMCGWLKDKFGVSWQIVPAALNEMMADPDPARAERVTQALLQMRKIDTAVLQKAYAGS